MKNIFVDILVILACIILMLVILNGGFSNKEDGSEPEYRMEEVISYDYSSEPKEIIYYTVQNGDNMWGIAEMHGIPYDVLMEYNSSMKDPSQIFKGDRVRVPVFEPIVKTVKVPNE